MPNDDKNVHDSIDLSDEFSITRDEKPSYVRNQPSRTITAVISKLLLLFFALSLILYTVIFWVVPIATLNYIQTWYEEQGAGHSLNIGQWSFNPISGLLELSNIVAIYSDNEGEKRQQTIGKAVLNWQLQGLLSKSIVIERILFDDVVLRLEQDSNHNTFMISGINLDVSDNSSTELISESNDLLSQPEGIKDYIQGIIPDNWRVVINRIDLSKQQYQYIEAITHNNRTLKQKVDISTDFSSGRIDTGDLSPIDINLQLSVNSANWTIIDQSIDPTDVSTVITAPVVTIKSERPQSIEFSGSITHLESWGGISGDLYLSNINIVSNNDSIPQPESQDDYFMIDNVSFKALKSSWDGELVSNRFEKFEINQLELNSNAVGDVRLDQYSIDEFEFSMKPFAEQWDWQLNTFFKSMVLTGFDAKNIPAEYLMQNSQSPSEVEGISDASLPIAVNLNNASVSDFRIITTDSEPSISTSDIVLNDIAILFDDETLSPWSVSEYRIDEITGDRRDISIGRNFFSGVHVSLVRQRDGSVLPISIFPANQKVTDDENLVKGVNAQNAISKKQSTLTDEEMLVKYIDNNSDANNSDNNNPNNNNQDSYTDNSLMNNSIMKELSNRMFDEIESLPFKVAFKGYEFSQEPDEKSTISVTDLYQFSDTSNIASTENSGFKQIFYINKFESTGFDSQNLSNPITIDLELQLDEFSTADVESTFKLVPDDIEITLSSDAKQIDLTYFNNYISDLMGYNLERGQLNSETNMTIKQGIVSGQSDIHLQNSRFVPSDPAIIKKLSKQISMPVETVLSVLKDKNNNINITVPLSGRVDDPNIGLSDVLKQISRKAIMTSTLFYLKQSLQPYGAALSLSTYAGEQLFAIRLDSILFDLGSSEINEKATDQLSKIRDVMITKTQLQLKMCPFITQNEMIQNKEADRDLGRMRGTVLKKYLSQYQDNNGRKLGDRVTICSTQTGKMSEVIVGF